MCSSGLSIGGIRRRGPSSSGLTSVAPTAPKPTYSKTLGNLTQPRMAHYSPEKIIYRARIALEGLHSVQLPEQCSSLIPQLDLAIEAASKITPSDQKEADSIIGRISQDQQPTVINAALSRLNAEGNYFGDMHQQLIDTIPQGGCSRIGDVPVVKVNPLLFTFLTGGIGLAANSKYLRAIYSMMDPPSSQDTLRSLATVGTLPEYFACIHHEWIHTKEMKTREYALNMIATGVRLASIGGVVLAGFTQNIGFALGALAVGYIAKYLHPLAKRSEEWQLLREVHAYEAELNPSGTLNNELSDKAFVLDKILRAKTYGGNENSTISISPDGSVSIDGVFSERGTLIGSAFDQIRQLKLLGMPTEKVDAIIRTTQYDTSSKTFPELSTALYSLREEFNLGDDETYRCVIEALESGFELNRLLLRHRAQEITVEESRRFASY